MLAFLQNLNPVELLVVAVVAVLIFGRRLPEVAGQAAGRLQRLRRTFGDLKRDSGLDDELREARRIWREAADVELRERPGRAASPRIEAPDGRLARRDPAAPEAASSGAPSEGVEASGEDAVRGPESRVEPATPAEPADHAPDGDAPGGADEDRGPADR